VIASRLILAVRMGIILVTPVFLFHNGCCTGPNMCSNPCP